MATIKTEPSHASVGRDIKVLICAAGESPLPVVLRDGARVIIENSSGKAVLVQDKEDRQEEADGKIQVYIYDTDRIKKSPVYKVKPSDKVFMLKYQICERELIPPNKQCLINRCVLRDLGTFEEYRVQNNDVITLRLIF